MPVGLYLASLAGLTPELRHGAVPESVFVMFELAFAIITPALIVGPSSGHEIQRRIVVQWPVAHFCVCANDTHGVERHGAITLLAALSVLHGQVIGWCQPRHIHVDWLQSLKKIDWSTAKDEGRRSNDLDSANARQVIRPP